MNDKCFSLMRVFAWTLKLCLIFSVLSIVFLMFNFFPGYASLLVVFTAFVLIITLLMSLVFVGYAFALLASGATMAYIREDIVRFFK